MARRKSARSLATRRFDKPVDKLVPFPINDLPAELIHTVYSYLKPTEVANLRLCSRILAALGLQYLVPEVHLFLAKESFKRLQDIAEHPIVSKYVTSFFYEGDKLAVYDQELWESRITSPQYLARLRQAHRESLNQRYLLRSHKGVTATARAMPRHQYTKQQLTDAFSRYEDYWHYQFDDLHQRHLDIATAMKRFPRLKEIIMSTGALVRPYTHAIQKAFEPGYCQEFTDDTPPGYGVPQMGALLMGACQAGLELQSLDCGYVDWHIFTQDEDTNAELKKSLRCLRDLSLDITVDEKYDEDGFSEMENCEEFLQNGRLRDFITSAPQLRSLNICFSHNEPVYPTDLKQVVGDFTWPSLRSVGLQNIETCEENLVSFCERHARTLKNLNWESLGLSEGEWWPVFEKIGPMLNLASVSLSGYFESMKDTLQFDTGDAEERPYLKEAIELYLLADTPDNHQSLDEFIENYLREPGFYDSSVVGPWDWEDDERETTSFNGIS
ncbi:hypothetical protein MMC28_003882 [Mycoblastus sanguinarius]|nr:hypothetical protein [Mycoblastus sanguinarius]